MVPEGWRTTKLGKVFKSRRERGTAGLPTISVTLRGGLVLRESLDRKTDTTLSPEEHLLVRKGDIAYNMMRMWQGASGLASFDAIVSPVYVVATPTKEIDPVFASYFFKSARMIYLFWAYSYGLTKDRLRLYYPDFSLIPVVLPPAEEQRRIGKILTTCERAINIVGRIVQNSAAQQRALLQKFFSESSTKGWKLHTIGSLGTTYGGLTGKSQEDFGTGVPYIPYLNIFTNPKIDLSHLDYVLIQPRERQHRVKYGDSFFTTSSEVPNEVGMSSVLLDEVGEIYLNSFCFGFRPHSFDVLTPEFSRFLFRSPRVRRSISHLAQGATRYNLPKGQFLRLSIPLPTVDEQLRIANCLASAEAVVAKHKAQLGNLQALQQALTQLLIPGKLRVMGNETPDPLVAVGMTR